MDETNSDWDDLRLFLAVARGGGLAAAKETTGKSPPTLGRRMLALERRLGRDLFHRHARGYELTEDGESFLRQVEDLERQVAPLVEPDADKMSPLVKVSAGTWVTQLLCRHVAEIIGDSMVRLRFTSSEAVQDIGRREALIGIRNRRPDEVSAAGVSVGRVQFAAYAMSPKVQTWARVLGRTPSALWVEAQSKDAPSIEVSTPRNALDLARAGVARAVVPTFAGDHHDDLMRVTSPIDSLEHDQWLVMHNEDRFIPDVRRVIDRIADVLRTHSVAHRP